MSKFSELIRRIQQVGKRHTRLVLAGKDTKSVHKEWVSLALMAAKKAKSVSEVIRISELAPSGSEAGILADSKLKEIMKGLKEWDEGGRERIDARVFELQTG